MTVMQKGIIKVLLVSVSSLIITFHARGQAPNILSVDFWEEKFLTDTAYSYPLDLNFSVSKDSWQLYKLAYGLDAYNAMYEATGKIEYLNRSLKIIQNVIHASIVSRELPRSQFKDSYRGWANHSHEENGDDGKEYPLFESFLWRYVSSFLRIVYESPDLMAQPMYKEAYKNILEFTEINIYQKWKSRGLNHIYRANTHMFSHWARICLNLWIITKNDEYKVVADDFTRLLTNQLHTNLHASDSYWWDARWIEGKRTILQRLFSDRSRYRAMKGQDVPHGNAVVAFMIEGYELGLYFNSRDIRRLINTFMNVVWKDNDVIAEFLDGSGNSYGKISDGFMKLGRYDGDLQRRLEKFDLNKNTVYNRWAQYYANGALNAKMLMD